ncbi:hypothetical protein CP967_20380 [Streptomyces nitrosporeus]|uniref:Uncharacterized protein n=1 Tax=Streptomyces nitrosporeus TaxID=28894 RepID=A0A5J6FE03_9ACTN|nr:hypothetical protein CP967_20380 [Streptomyces nitrosporeus]GGZ00301.1 hypothetical protein GCM10010327_33430 [Streptomyces nitrosporeus]
MSPGEEEKSTGTGTARPVPRLMWTGLGLRAQELNVLDAVLCLNVIERSGMLRTVRPCLTVRSAEAGAIDVYVYS